MYGARAAAYYRTNELHSYQPDSLRESEDNCQPKGVFKPLSYEKVTDSDTFFSQQQSEDLITDKWYADQNYLFVYGICFSFVIESVTNYIMS